MHQEIKLQRIETPPKKEVDTDIEWLCNSFGFITPRDKDETAAKIFKIIIDATVKRLAMSSEQIATRADISRAAALYHIKNYMEAGLIIQERTTYILRTHSLMRTVEEVELDVQRIFANLKRIAKDVDEQLGLVYR